MADHPTYGNKHDAFADFWCSLGDVLMLAMNQRKLVKATNADVKNRVTEGAEARKQQAQESSSPAKLTLC